MSRRPPPSLLWGAAPKTTASTKKTRPRKAATKVDTAPPKKAGSTTAIPHPIPQAEWDERAGSTLYAVSKLYTKGVMGLVWKGEWDQTAFKAFRIANEAIHCMWGAGGEGDVAGRVALIDRIYLVIAGAADAQAIRLIRFSAAQIKKARDADTREYETREFIAALASLRHPEARDVASLSERLPEICEWLGRSTDGRAKRGAKGGSRPHAVLARLLAASRGEPTEGKAIKASADNIARRIERDTRIGGT